VQKYKLFLYFVLLSNGLHSIKKQLIVKQKNGNFNAFALKNMIIILFFLLLLQPENIGYGKKENFIHYT